MNLTTEQKLAINMKVARDMWPDWVIEPNNSGVEAYINMPVDFLFNVFDKTDRTDLNKAVEFYEIDVVRFINNKSWGSRLMRSIDVHFDKSRDESMRAAVTAASGANQTKEDK